MSYTREQIDTLRALQAKGIKTVITDGNTVTYASLDEMSRVIARMEASIASSTSSRSRITYPTFERGI